MKDKRPVKKVSTGQKPLTHTVGRRKSAVARVWLRKGSGNVVVNGENYNEYFDTDIARIEAVQALQLTQVDKQYDIDARVAGGGLRGQANALKLGIARALVNIDENFKSALRKNGLLTVDSRLKERKKYGQRGARRKFQFVKR